MPTRRSSTWTVARSAGAEGRDEGGAAPRARGRFGPALAGLHLPGGVRAMPGGKRVRAPLVTAPAPDGHGQANHRRERDAPTLTPRERRRYASCLRTSPRRARESSTRG